MKRRDQPPSALFDPDDESDLRLRLLLRSLSSAVDEIQRGKPGSRAHGKRMLQALLLSNRLAMAIFRRLEASWPAERTGGRIDEQGCHSMSRKKPDLDLDLILDDEAPGRQELRRCMLRVFDDGTYGFWASGASHVGFESLEEFLAEVRAWAAGEGDR